MFHKPPFLIDLLHFCEFIAAVISLIYYKSVKNTYWKWFVIYMTFIFICELFGIQIFNEIGLNEDILFSYFTIPIEFLFFIWLYAFKSLKIKKLFIVSTMFYLLSFIPEFSLEKGKFFFDSFNYMVGALILLILVSLEFLKQIKNENILMFMQNKMFYINIGVILFYIGNMPFFGLYYLILKEPQIWNSYYIYFLISNCIMYLLFAASFIWGKPKL